MDRDQLKREAEEYRAKERERVLGKYLGIQREDVPRETSKKRGRPVGWRKKK